jgi:hypothetical protein
MKITSEQLYGMKLDDIFITDANSFIKRVSGGWIYYMRDTAVFVPYNNEFQV